MLVRSDTIMIGIVESVLKKHNIPYKLIKKYETQDGGKYRYADSEIIDVDTIPLTDIIAEAKKHSIKYDGNGAWDTIYFTTNTHYYSISMLSPTNVIDVT